VHQRRIIREKVADHLAANAPAFGGTPEAPGNSRVFKCREAPGNVNALLEEGPIANVYARRDHIKPEDYPTSGFDGGVRRTLELAVEVTAAGSWTVDEKLDDLSDEIESLLENFEVPGLPAAELRLLSTEIDYTDEFYVPLGGALLVFEDRYWRPYRTDTSDENKICEVFVNGPDGVIAKVGECAGICVPGPV
jgi:hypothetical protein